MSYAIPGSRCAVFVAGIKYASIFTAASETEISQCWLNTAIKKNDGAPVIVRNQLVVTEFWIHTRLKKEEVKI